MSWLEHHKESEQQAGNAEYHARMGENSNAMSSYRLAADAEERALDDLDKSKRRTYGITAVSAVALRFKARDYPAAQNLAHAHLGTGELPEFAQVQLRELLETMWDDLDRLRTGLRPSRSEIEFSLKGGTVLSGSAPADVVMGLVGRAEALVYRVTEYTHGLPHRTDRTVPPSVKSASQIRVAAATSGSYRFRLSIDAPAQMEMFGPQSSATAPSDVARASVGILRAGLDSPHVALPALVTDQAYRATFLKLARDLSPNGRRWNRLEIRSAAADQPITMNQQTRQALNEIIRASSRGSNGVGGQEETITGILRAVNLENDWLDVVTSGEPSRIRIRGVGVTLDDQIGPMLNQPVIVTTVRRRGESRRLIDIEPDD